LLNFPKVNDPPIEIKANGSAADEIKLNELCKKIGNSNPDNENSKPEAQASISGFLIIERTVILICDLVEKCSPENQIKIETEKKFTIGITKVIMSPSGINPCSPNEFNITAIPI